MDNGGGIVLGLVIGFFLCLWMVSENSRLVQVNDSNSGFKYVEYENSYYKLEPIKLKGIPKTREDEN